MSRDLTAAAVVAVRILRLGGIVRRADAQAVLLRWVRPPKLSAEDMAAVLASFPPEQGQTP